MFQKIAKHRANDASNDVHRPPLTGGSQVPSLEKDEYKRERDFYAERGMPCPKVCHFA